MLISVQVPMTTGAAFGAALQQHFGARLLLDHADRPLAPGHAWRRLGHMWPPPAARLAALAPFDCVHGHFVADKYAFLGARARFITWLRDPVQRVASHYRYWQRVPDLRNPDCRALIERRLSLAEFAALPRMRDVGARFLGRRPLRAFYCIGLAEDVPASALRLWRLTGIRMTVDAKPDPAADAAVALTPALRALIDHLNPRDRVLYEQARDAF